MNRLTYYKTFIKESKEDIDSICRKYNIRNYVVNEDGTVDVDGDVNLVNRGLTELPLKFRKVGGGFSCSENELTSLDGAPREVGRRFYCHNNQLTSLEGSPREVGGYFGCSNNKLTSLEGAPEKVGGYFFCRDNKLLSLEGISKYISGGIDCRYNKIIDVRGVKDGWRGSFLVEDNPIHEIFKLFPFERRDEVIDHLNDYNVIRDGKVVILQALERVFWELDLEVPEIEEIKGYKIQF